MKTFTEVLTESKKTYEFKVGVAGELGENFTDALETCMKKYQVVSMSNGKKTPIQERPLDFPQLENMEVTYWDVEVAYPTTPQVLEEYIEKCCPCDPNHVIVRTANAPQEEYQAPKSGEPYQSKLDTLEMEQAEPDAQKKVAGDRVMDLLKELETARKERNVDPMEAAPKGESADIDDKINTKAVVGG
jgi:hypothetical protein